MLIAYITIHSSYLIVFLKLVFEMKCMLHEVNHFKATVCTQTGLCSHPSNPFPDIPPCGPGETPGLGHHFSLLWFCGVPLLDFSGKRNLTAGPSQGEKETPGEAGGQVLGRVSQHGQNSFS